MNRNEKVIIPTMLFFIPNVELYGEFLIIEHPFPVKHEIGLSERSMYNKYVDITIFATIKMNMSPLMYFIKKEKK